MPDPDRRFIVGGVELPRPFRVRRLGHFGLNVADPEASRDCYERLLGLRISDRIDFSGRLTAAQLAGLGPPVGYFLRHNPEHHTFVFFPRRVYDALNPFMLEAPEVSVNQITWQVGSMREVFDGGAFFREHGLRIQRTGRDLPGSNWNVYPFDPEGHVNELFYGIEQCGWNGRSKPVAMHGDRVREPPPLPHISEYAEVDRAVARGIDVDSGWRSTEPAGETFDVGGVLLARPFKVVRVGPVRLFVRDMERMLAFYIGIMGLTVTEEVTWEGHRCVFLRANTEHHSIALYPIALRSVLGLNPTSTLFSFGFQLADYGQLKDAVGFLRKASVTIRHLPPELFPGIDYTAFFIDPDGNAMQLYYYMEQVGWDGRTRPPASRPSIDNERCPDTVPARSDTYLGEAYLGPWN